jgi:hypothetical protein
MYISLRIREMRNTYRILGENPEEMSYFSDVCIVLTCVIYRLCEGCLPVLGGLLLLR